MVISKRSAKAGQGRTGKGAWKIELRPVVEGDQPLLLAWRQDREVMRHLPSAPSEPTWTMQWRWWIGRKDRDDWMIIVPGDGSVPARPVGTVHYDRASHELGIIIGEKSTWGKGLATEVLRKVVSMIEDDLVWAAIHPENVGSQIAFKNAGFTKTGKPARNGQEEWVLVRHKGAHE